MHAKLQRASSVQKGPCYAEGTKLLTVMCTEGVKSLKVILVSYFSPMIAIGVYLPSRIHVFDLEVKCHINFNCKDDVILWLLGT